MKLRFNPTIVKTWFSHERSESEIIVEAITGGVLITLSDDNNSSATLELTSKQELVSLKEALSGLKGISYREVRGFFDGNVVLNVGYDNYGDPYEECIKFTFSIADSSKQWGEKEVSASLELHNKDEFIHALSICF